MATETVNTIFQAKDGITNIVSKIEKTTTSGFRKMADEAKRTNSVLSQINFKDTIRFADDARNKIVGLAKAFGQIVNDAGQASAIRSTFDAFGGAAINISRVRKEIDYTVDSLTLMQSANRGLLLGLPLTTSEMSRAANIARILGQAMGQDAAKSLDDLITGFGRGSALILDNLGIVVNAAEAQKKYAASVGKTVQELTSAETKLAVFKSGMDAAEKVIRDTGLSANETKTSIDQMIAAFSDFGTEVKVAAVDAGGGSAFSAIAREMRELSAFVKVHNLGMKEDYKNNIEYWKALIEAEDSLPPWMMKEVEFAKKIVPLYDAMAEGMEKIGFLKDREAERQKIINEAIIKTIEIEEARANVFDKDRSGTRNDMGYALTDSIEVIQLKQQKVQLLDMENLKMIELANNGERLSTLSGRAFQTEQTAIAIKREYLQLLNEHITMEQALTMAKQQQMDAELGQASAVAGQLRTLVGENTKAGRAIAAVQGILEAARAYAAFAAGNYWSGAMHSLSSLTFFKVSGGGGGVRATGGGSGQNNSQPFNPLQAPQNTRQQPTIIIHTTWDQQGFNTTIDGRAVNAVSQDINKGGQVMRTFQTAAGRF